MNNQMNHARAAMDVLAALQDQPVVAVEPAVPTAVAAPAASAAVAVATRPARAAARAGVQAREPVSAPAGLDGFTRTPRSGARRLAGFVLLLAAPATALVAWAAYTSRDTTLGGLALILAALTTGLWFMRVIAVPTSVSLVGPLLEVRQGDRRYAWDLSSAYSPVDHVRGRPGRSGWRVILRNPDGTSFALDGSMVPAKRFTETLARYRPEF
jgi:hypothetical protein